MDRAIEERIGPFALSAGLPDRNFQDKDPAQDGAHCAAPAPTTDDLDRGQIEVEA